jgi:hypothetical protein
MPTFKPDDIELIPDAWGRFERAVDAVSKSGPQHRPPRRPQFSATDDMRVIFRPILDPSVEATPAFAQAYRAVEALLASVRQDKKKD